MLKDDRLAGRIAGHVDLYAIRKGEVTLYADLRHGAGVEAVVQFVECHGGLAQVA